MQAEDGDDGADSDTNYEVRHLAPGEDLVIDGQTAVDDMLVAQRIAERESLLMEETRELVAAVAGSQAQASRGDVAQLLQLLRQANDLSKRISSMPAKFDNVMGGEVRAACRAATQALERIPLDEAAAEEADEEEKLDPEAALAEVDLQSTDEEEQAAAAPLSSGPELEENQEDGKVASDGEDRGAVEEAVEEEEEAVEEEDEDLQNLRKAADQALLSTGREMAEEADSESEEEEEELATTLEPLQIRVDGFPERVGEADTIETVGKVSSAVENLVVVAGALESRALDLQSVLCLQDRAVFGVVVDVFGPVTQPHYLVHPTGSGQVPHVGAEVFAAVALPETSFLAESSDITALRLGLAAGNSEDESDEEEEEDDKDEDAVTPGQLALTDGEAALANRGHSRPGRGGRKGAGKKGKKSKGKGRQSGKGEVRHMSERLGVWANEDDSIGEHRVENDENGNSSTWRENGSHSSDSHRWSQTWKRSGGSSEEAYSGAQVKVKAEQDWGSGSYNAGAAAVDAAGAREQQRPGTNQSRWRLWKGRRTGQPERQDQQGTEAASSDPGGMQGAWPPPAPPAPPAPPGAALPPAPPAPPGAALPPMPPAPPAASGRSASASPAPSRPGGAQQWSQSGADAAATGAPPRRPQVVPPARHAARPAEGAPNPASSSSSTLGKRPERSGNEWGHADTSHPRNLSTAGPREIPPPKRLRNGASESGFSTPPPPPPPPGSTGSPPPPPAVGNTGSRDSWQANGGKGGGPSGYTQNGRGPSHSGWSAQGGSRGAPPGDSWQSGRPHGCGKGGKPR